MKKLLLLPLILIFSFSISQAQDKPTPAWSVYFSPKGGCTEAIVHELDRAKKSVLVQAYSFTSAPIAKAFLSAHKRGVKVLVVLDKSQRTEKYSSADFLANNGITVKIDAAHAIAHNKVMVIDGETVRTGSFNFTKAAEDKNAENLLVIRDKTLAEKYARNWYEHEGHSETYKGKGIKRGGLGIWANAPSLKAWSKMALPFYLRQMRLGEFNIRYFLVPNTLFT